MSLNNVTKVNQECNSSEENKPIVYWDGKHFASKDKSSLADIPLYTSPQIKPTITKLDGKVVAVTMTDDEHRITEVLWEAPKPLSDEEMKELINNFPIIFSPQDLLTFGRAIEERHGIK